MIHMVTGLSYRVDNDKGELIFGKKDSFSSFTPRIHFLRNTDYNFFDGGNFLLTPGVVYSCFYSKNVAYLKSRDYKSVLDLFSSAKPSRRAGEFTSQVLCERMPCKQANHNIEIRNADDLKAYSGALVFVRQEPKPSSDGLFIPVKYGLYRLGFSRLAAPQFSLDLQDHINKYGLTFDKDDPNLELLHYRPYLTELDSVTIAMDWQTPQFRFVLRDETVEGGWLPLTGKQLSKYKPIFRIQDFYSPDNLVDIAKSILNSRNIKKSFGGFVKLLQNSPLIRNMSITYNQSCPKALSLLVYATDLSESGPIHKGFGVSKIILKHLISTLNDSLSLARNLLTTVQQACDLFGPQVAENMLGASVEAADFVNRREVLQNTRNYDFPITTVFTNIVQLSRRYKNYDYRHFCRYITDEVYTYQAITSPSEAIQLLDDYYRALDGQGIKIDEWFPRSLKLSHDIAVRNAAVVMATKNKEKFKNVANSPEYVKLGWKHGDYMVITPKEPKDVIREGKRQCHCVGSYVERITNGNTKICFMRKVNDPDTPVLTLEVRETEGVPTLVQCRGNSNRAPAKKEAEWVQRWCDAKHLKNSYYN